MGCQLIHQLPVTGKHLFGFLIAFLQDFHYFCIYISCCSVTAGQSCTASKIFIFYRGKPHQTKPFTHTKPGHHIGCNIGCRLNIICSARSHIAKDQFLSSTSTKQADKSVMKLCLCLQIFLFFRHMHDIAKSSHGSGNDRDFLHRLGIFLQSTDQCMTNLMVRNDPSFLLAHDPIFLFLTYKHLLYRFKQILLIYIFSAMLHRIDRCLIDHIGKIRTNSSACCQCDRVQIHTVIQMDILGMYLQDRYSSLQIRLIYNDTSVKSSGTQQCLIQNLRSVGCTKHQDSFGGIKAIHFRKELVQCLFSFFVATAIFAVTASSDGIYLIDENNAGGILGCFLKQISYSGSTYTYI